jgi:thiamine-phosphate pyrophosphorylase
VNSTLQDLIKGQVNVIQLRAKELTTREFFDLANDVREYTCSAGCLLIINDRVDVALACRADGVHLGQEDLPLDIARKLMGDALVGISTHDLGQAQEAVSRGADYIGFGPIFATVTKSTGYTPRGIETLHEIRRAVRLPIVAIGGITEHNVAEVWQAGADSAAMISGLLGAEDIETTAKRVSDVYARLAGTRVQ